MLKFRFNKLVRDKIVEQQIASGAKPKYRILDHDEHVKFLVDKIIEESKEIVDASKEEMAGEIADVQQAIDDLIEKLGLTRDAVVRAQHKKNVKAGAFARGFYVDHVEVMDDNEWVAYYRKNPDRYPEIS
ncbi:MAG TPA: nucleoside triphosphate pyrophosphohydrolase [Verrucomicrobiae bacterium]|nr:nucleoside triphosphate pyrophosphohydrolase [Verrucomicrobiae bacterium]